MGFFCEFNTKFSRILAPDQTCPVQDYYGEDGEKPVLTDKWVNGGFFIVEPAALEYIEGDNTQWEKDPLQRLAQEDQLVAYRHGSFWQCMDTVYDKNVLENLWIAGEAPWKIWS